jgi:hypothetical protein
MRAFTVTIGSVLAVLLGLAVWGCFGLTRVAYIALEKWGDSAPGPTKPAVDSTTALLDFVRRPCASLDKDGHLLPDGPICELDQAIHDIRKITTASGKQVQQTGQLVDATAKTMETVGESVKDTASHLDKTADAGTETLQAASKTLDVGTTTLAEVNDRAVPLMAAYTRSGEALDDLLRENAVPLHTTLVHVAGMSESGDKMLVDAQWKTHRLLHPDKVKLTFWSGTQATVQWIHQNIIPPLF